MLFELKIILENVIVIWRLDHRIALLLKMFFVWRILCLVFEKENKHRPFDE